MASGIVMPGQVLLQDCKQDEQIRNQAHRIDAWYALIRMLECQELQPGDRGGSGLCERFGRKVATAKEVREIMKIGVSSMLGGIPRFCNVSSSCCRLGLTAETALKTLRYRRSSALCTTTPACP